MSKKIKLTDIEKLSSALIAIENDGRYSGEIKLKRVRTPFCNIMTLAGVPQNVQKYIQLRKLYDETTYAVHVNPSRRMFSVFAFRTPDTLEKSINNAITLALRYMRSHAFVHCIEHQLEDFATRMYKLQSGYAEYLDILIAAGSLTYAK